MGYPIKQNQTARPLVFLMVDSTDHVSPRTGLAPTVSLSKNGSSFAAPSGAVAEIGNGWYKVAGNATDASTLGPLLLHATATGADPTDDRFDVIARDPHEERVDVGKWLGAAVAAPSVDGVPVIDIGYVVGQAASTVSGPIDANITQVAGQVVSATGAVNFSHLDAAVSSRSIYAGDDTVGVATLLDRLTTERATNLDNLDAAVSSRSTLDANAVWSNTTRTLSAFDFGVTVATNTDKIGYVLAPSGLDSISTTAPTGVPNTFRDMLVMLYRRFFKKTILDGATITTYTDDGNTVLTTQAIVVDGPTQIQGAAS